MDSLASVWDWDWDCVWDWDCDWDWDCVCDSFSPKSNLGLCFGDVFAAVSGVGLLGALLPPPEKWERDPCQANKSQLNRSQMFNWKQFDITFRGQPIQFYRRNTETDIDHPSISAEIRTVCADLGSLHVAAASTAHGFVPASLCDSFSSPPSFDASLDNRFDFCEWREF